MIAIGGTKAVPSRSAAADACVVDVPFRPARIVDHVVKTVVVLEGLVHDTRILELADDLVVVEGVDRVLLLLEDVERLAEYILGHAVTAEQPVAHALDAEPGIGGGIASI